MRYIFVLSYIISSYQILICKGDADTSSTTTWSPFPHWGRLIMYNPLCIKKYDFLSKTKGITKQIGATPFSLPQWGKVAAKPTDEVSASPL